MTILDICRKQALGMRLEWRYSMIREHPQRENTLEKRDQKFRCKSGVDLPSVTIMLSSMPIPLISGR